MDKSTDGQMNRLTGWQAKNTQFDRLPGQQNDRLFS